MKGNLVIFILTVFVSYEGLAQSAQRELDRDYSLYEKEFIQTQSLEEMSTARSVLRSARLFNEGFSVSTVSWKATELQTRFERLRDEKSLSWQRMPEIPRRASWLFPDDGCWTRAAIANRTAFQLFYPLPDKVFAFGNLRVNTKNSPRGVVGWWYHVAPIIEVASEKYVIDPSIEWSRPLTLKEWLQRMGNPEKIKVAICSSGSYSPGDRCDKVTNGLELQAESVQQHYLGLEWRRMSDMGRSSEL